MSSTRHRMLQLRSVALSIGLALTALASQAQTTALATPRILAPVNTSQLVTLDGNKHPLAQPRFDRGALPDTTPTGRLMMVLRRSDAQQAALETLLAAQQDPKSPNFHKWLKPEDFGAQFGVSDADIQAVTSYLASQGFAVSRIAKNKMAIEFSGTMGQMRSAFQTEIHSYAVNGQVFHANASNPRIPAALAPVVGGFASLNNYKAPAPAAQQMVLDKKTGRAKPLYADPIARAEAVSPGDLRVIYDIPSSFTGTGVTVGIVNDSNVNLSIPTNYRSTFGLTARTAHVIIDGDDPGLNFDELSGYEQMELLAAVAPDAAQNYYIAASSPLETGINLAAIRAVEDNAVQVLLFGFESCEQALGGVGNTLYTNLWEQAAAQGISVITTSGTGGSAECDAQSGSGTFASTATQGLAVNGYASTPYATAVGSSDFFYGPTGTVNPNDPNDPFFTYWSNDPTRPNFTSALRYIPEQPANSSYQPDNQIPSNPSLILASGGGVSALGMAIPNPDFSYTLVAHTQPSYQVGVVPASLSLTARVVPDVSIYGGSPTNGSQYILCALPTDCVGGGPGTLIYHSAFNGAAPASVFAGVAALVVQAKGVQGNLNPILYALATPGNTVFHDITNGSNAVACQGPDCGANGLTTANGGLAYPATPGYDAASGLGSVDVTNLINAWKNPSGSANVTLTITQPGSNVPFPGPIPHGQPIQTNVTVTGSSGTPTGDVAITTTAPLPNNAGTQRITLDNTGHGVSDGLNVLPGGTYSLVARYAGDGTHRSAVTSIPVTVTSAASELVVSEGSQNFANGALLPYGSAVTVSFAVFNAADRNDVSRPTGSVSISDNGRALTTVPLNAEGVATFQSTTLAAGSHAFTANYNGDGSFTGSSLSSPPPTLTITGVPTTTSLFPSANTVASRNSSLILTANVAAAAGNAGTAPRGSVLFSSNGSVLGSAALGVGTITAPSPAPTFTPTASATLTLARNSIPANTNLSVIATYVPDASGDYAASASSPVAVGIGGARGLANSTVTLTTNPNNATTFSFTSSLIFTAAVTGPGGRGTPTGSVSFFANGALIGAAIPLDSSATANFTVPPDSNGLLALPIGQSDIVAEYSGDANHAASSTVRVVNVYGVQGGTPDFTMVTNQVYGTLSPSVATTTFTLQFGSVNNFAQYGTVIRFGFSTPGGIRCAATPTAPVFNGSDYATVNVTCGATPGFTIGKLTPPPTHLLWEVEGGAALACLFLFGMPARRRSWQSAIGALALIVVAFGISGCGVAGSSSLLGHSASAAVGADAAKAQAAGVLAPGRYTIIVLATAHVYANSQPNTTVTVVHNLPLTIVVQ